MKLTRRTVCFVQKPSHFEIKCPKCNGNNLDWSEFDKHIWCYDCEKDLKDYESPYSGPIPVHVSELLGIDLRMINLETGIITHPSDEDYGK